MISVAILTKGPPEKLISCLRTVQWCNQIIIINDGSELNGFNRSLKSQFLKPAEIFNHRLNGNFAAQHNLALLKAKHEWVLFVDDDEQVSTVLAQEIISILKKSSYTGYTFHRKDYFWNRSLKHGETSAVKLLRLARKTSGLWQRSVHEIWEIKGSVGEIRTPIDHFPHPTIHEFISSINFYTSLDSPQLEKEGKPFSLVMLLLKPAAKFLQNYVFRLGFLDGLPGFVVAFMMSFQSLVVRVKQYESVIKIHHSTL